MNADLQFRAYFESEAVRCVVNPTDYAFAVAVNRIADDNGASFRTWLAGADEMIKGTLRRAYEDQNAKNFALHQERLAAARRAFETARAEGASKKKALKAGQSVYSRFSLVDIK